MDPGKKILSDPVNSWVFDQSPQNTYLVGGYLRDILRGKTSADRDFVLKGDIEGIGKKAAKAFGGKFIALHNRQTIRVAIKQHNFIDFTHLDNAIMDDLQRRDYTINALAWSPGSGVLAPDHAFRDIENGVIRHIRQRNLLDDPLRILRAYRLSAQMNFTILPDTRRLLKKYSKHLDSASPERITEELFKLLNSDKALNALTCSLIDNVLSRLVRLSIDNIVINLAHIADFETLLTQKSRILNQLNMFHHLMSNFSQGLSTSGFIRLFLLCRLDTQNVRYSEKRPTISETLNNSLLLRPSCKIGDSLRTLERVGAMSSCVLTNKILFEIFLIAGDCVYEAALLCILRKPRGCRRIIEKARDYMHKRNKPLINGNDIQKMLGRGPGREIGRIKEDVFRNHFLGKIRNQREAERFIMANFT